MDVFLTVCAGARKLDNGDRLQGEFEWQAVSQLSHAMARRANQILASQGGVEMLVKECERCV